MCILTDERLPFTSSTRVTSEVAIRLETNFTVERRQSFALVAGGTGEECTLELGLDEKLGVENVGGRIEGSSGDGLINVVGSSDSVTIDIEWLIVHKTSNVRDTYEARRATTSAGLKPASAKRARILVTSSKGSGTSRSGEACLASGRPKRN